MSTVKDITESLDAKVLCREDLLENKVNTGFVGDLLSIVMGKAKDECAWITIQSHLNIVAVGVLINASCIIVTEGFEVEENAIEKAIEEGIPILSTTVSSFQAATILSKLGIN